MRNSHDFLLYFDYYTIQSSSFFKGVIIQSNLSLHVTSLNLAQKKKYLIFYCSYVPNKTASAKFKIIDWRHLILTV